MKWSHARFSALVFATLVSPVSAARAQPADPLVTVFIGTYTRGWACPPQAKNTPRLHQQGHLPGAASTHAPARSASRALAAESDNPSYLAIIRDGKFLYAVNEVGDFNGEKNGRGQRLCHRAGRQAPAHQPAVLPRRRPLPRLARPPRASTCWWPTTAAATSPSYRVGAQGRAASKAAPSPTTGHPRPPREPGRRPRPLHRSRARRPGWSTSPTSAWTRCCSTIWTPHQPAQAPRRRRPSPCTAARQRPPPPGHPPQQEVPLHQQRARHRGLGLRPRSRPPARSAAARCRRSAPSRCPTASPATTPRSRSARDGRFALRLQPRPRQHRRLLASTRPPAS